MDGSKLLLYPMNNATNLELYVRNTEWELIDFAVKMYEKVYDCCPYPFPDITYFVALKRSPSYYIFSLIIPSAFITVVTIVGFFTPHSTTGENTEKVSTAVTALLSMTIIIMMVSDEVPATSEHIPLIGKYYIGLIFIIFIAAFTTTLTLAFQMRGNAGARMSNRMKYFLFERVAKSILGTWIFTIQITNKRSIRRFRIRSATPSLIDQQQKTANECASRRIIHRRHHNERDSDAQSNEQLTELSPYSTSATAAPTTDIDNNKTTYVFENNYCQQHQNNTSVPDKATSNNVPHTNSAKTVQTSSMNGPASRYNNVGIQHSSRGINANNFLFGGEKRARIVKMDDLLEMETQWKTR
uniref:Neurotransmitter-gated ion-channel transmembrane domain-containing protein n=1 Tax=Ditylenchus dipsaci TaxID=166011 RepID=A0A915EB17_9BILA